MKPEELEELREIFEDALKMTRKINLSLSFLYKGIRCYVNPRGTTEMGLKNYQISLEKGYKYTFNRGD
jgi:hypothetical protein